MTTTPQTATPNKEVKLSIAVDKDLARAFKATAKANDRTQSVLLRDFMREYVKKHGQMSLGL